MQTVHGRQRRSDHTGVRRLVEDDDLAQLQDEDVHPLLVDHVVEVEPVPAEVDPV